MPKKMSDEARKAASERMKAFHAAKKAAKEAAVAAPPAEEPTAPVEPQTPQPEALPEDPTPTPETAVPGVTLTNEQFEMLLNRFSGMGKEPDTTTPTVGIVERFPIRPDAYVNPVEMLYDIPKLRRFGLRENYVIDWKVSTTRYETRQGQWYMEPRFELTLKRKQFNEEGEEVVKHDKHGKPFHPRIVLGRASFFVDPPADMIEAELAGLADADLSDEELQERMFFWRYSMWIEERLMPKLPDFTTNAMKEEVIGGKAYEIEEYSMPV
jgi:hypothetical protein